MRVRQAGQSRTQPSAVTRNAPQRMSAEGTICIVPRLRLGSIHHGAQQKLLYAAEGLDVGR